MTRPRYLLDTSVLLPAMVTAHENHQLARPWLERAIAGEFRLFLAAHSLAECFATLTRLPRGLGVSPAQASSIIRGNLIQRAKATIVALGTDDYLAVLDELSRGIIAGGVIYDALIARAARLHHAKVVTFNHRHFVHLVPDPTDLVIPR